MYILYIVTFFCAAIYIFLVLDQSLIEFILKETTQKHFQKQFSQLVLEETL